LRANGSVVRVQLTAEGAGVGIASALGDFENSDYPALSLSENTAAAPCSYTQ